MKALITRIFFPALALLLLLWSMSCGESQCSRDTDCDTGKYCISGRCDFDCQTNAQCNGGNICDSRGRCSPPGSSADGGGGGNDGSHGNGKLPQVAQALEGEVFAFTNYYAGLSKESLQNLNNTVGKLLVWFKRSGNDLRYVKVLMNLQNLGFVAWSGKVTWSGNTYYFQDERFCYGQNSVYERYKGDTIEVISESMRGCAAAESSPIKATLKTQQVRDRFYVYDPNGKFTLLKLHRRVPTSAANHPLRKLLGTYRQLAKPDGVTPTEPPLYMQMYVDPKGTFRYTLVRENFIKNDWVPLDIEEGTVTGNATQLTLKPLTVQLKCQSAFRLYVDEAPIYPLGFRFDSSCKQGNTPSQAPFAYKYDKLKIASSGRTLDRLVLYHAPTQRYTSYVKYGYGTNGFPATDNLGRHYIWAIIPKN